MLARCGRPSRARGSSPWRSWPGVSGASSRGPRSVCSGSSSSSFPRARSRYPSSPRSTAPTWRGAASPWPWRRCSGGGSRRWPCHPHASARPPSSLRPPSWQRSRSRPRRATACGATRSRSGRTRRARRPASSRRTTSSATRCACGESARRRSPPTRAPSSSCRTTSTRATTSASASPRRATSRRRGRSSRACSPGTPAMSARATTCAPSPHSSPRSAHTESGAGVLPERLAPPRGGAYPRRLGVRILHAIHDFLPRHRAGSELYAYHLCRALAERHQVAVLCAEYDPTRPHADLVRREYGGLDVFELVNNWAFASFEESYRSPAIGECIERVLDEFRPDLLHVHNLLNLSLELPALAKRRGVPVVATLHDHTLHCPSGGQRVHVAEEHVCEWIDTERCARCFPASPFAAQMVLARGPGRAPLPPASLRLLRALGRRFPRAGAAFAARASRAVAVSPDAIRERLRAVERAMEAVDLFVAPSRALAEEHLRLGIPAAKVRTSDYGFPPLAPASPPRVRDASAPLAIGFVGTLVWHKGVHVLLEAAARLPRERFEVLVFGDLETFPAYTARLRRLAAGLPVRFMGGFGNGEAASVYARLDVLVVPSLWPENSPLVIHEAFQAGVPVVGARIGGIPELLGENGLLYDAFSSADLAGLLSQLIDGPGELARLAASLPAVKSIERDAAEWEEIYAASLARSLPAQAAPA